MKATLINGVPGELIGSADRALQYGDGLFETIHCRDGRARWLDLHFERLRHGCDRLRLPFNDFAILEREIAALSAAQERCLVKLILTRGLATRRGYRPAGDERCNRILSCHAWPASRAPAASGFRLGVSSVRLGINPLLAGLKHLNRLEQVLAQMAMQDTQLDEVLMLSSDDEVIGGSMSNVFFADDAGLFTPTLDQCGVAGVMRRLVLEAAERLGTPVQVRAVHPNELASVHEAFVTNVRWGLQPVSVLVARALDCTEQAQRLWRVIDAPAS